MYGEVDRKLNTANWKRSPRSIAVSMGIGILISIVIIFGLGITLPVIYKIALALIPAIIGIAWARRNKRWTSR